MAGARKMLRPFISRTFRLIHAVDARVGLLFSKMCPRWHAGLFQLVVQRIAQCLTGARQAGHDGSNRNAHGISQLSVRQTLQLPEHEQFTKTIWHLAHRPREQGGVIGPKQ
jgi:hypothetical protein